MEFGCFVDPKKASHLLVPFLVDRKITKDVIVLTDPNDINSFLAKQKVGVRKEAKDILERVRKGWGGVGRYRRAKNMMEIIDRVLPIVPINSHGEVFGRLMRRHWSFIWLQTAWSRRALQKDIVRLRVLRDVMNHPSKVFKLLIEPELRALSAEDKKLIQKATVIQLLSVILIYFSRNYVDLVLGVVGASLLWATFLVAKCKSVNSDSWNYIFAFFGVFPVVGGFVVFFANHWGGVRDWLGGIHF